MLAMNNSFKRLLASITFVLPVTGLAVEQIDSVEEIGRASLSTTF